MSEVKFIFTADDSQLQNTLSRVEKSLKDISVVSSDIQSASDSSFSKMKEDISNVEKESKEAAKSFTDYSAKIKTLNLDIKALEVELSNIPLGVDKSIIEEKEKQIEGLKEKVKELNKLEAEALDASGVKFTIAAPTSIAPNKQEQIDFSATKDFDSILDKLNQMKEGLAETRLEYEKISQKANTGSSIEEQLNNTIPAIDATKTRFQDLSNAYYKALNTLQQLTAELEQAKKDGNEILSSQISGQISQLSPLVKQLEQEYSEISARGDELKSQKQGLISEQQSEESANAITDYAGAIRTLNLELDTLQSKLQNLSIEDNETETALVEKIAEIKSRIAELQKMEAASLENSGVKFFLDTPSQSNLNDPALLKENSSDLSSIIEHINHAKEALSQSRIEYDKIIKDIEVAQSAIGKLAATNDALNATFNRIGTIKETLIAASSELKNLNDRLEEAKTKGDEAFANTLEKQIKELKKQIPSLNKELEELIKKEDELRKSKSSLMASTEQERNATESTPKNKKSKVTGLDDFNMPESTKAFGELSKGIGQVTKGFQTMAQGGVGAAKGLSMVTGGIKLVSKALLSLLANPIVLIITGIVAAFAALGKALSAYFTQTSEGADKFAKFKGALEGIKAAISSFTIEVGRKVQELGNLYTKALNALYSAFTMPVKAIITAWKTVGETIVNIFKSIFEGIKNGDFSNIGDTIKKTVSKGLETIQEDAKDVGESFKEIGEAWNNITSFQLPNVGEYAKEYAKLAEEERKLTNDRLYWEKERAKLNVRKSSLQETMYSGSQIEQLKAMEEMRNVIGEKYKKEVEYAQKELDIQKRKNALAGRNIKIDDLKKQQDLEIALLNLQSQQNNELRTMGRRYKSINDGLYEQRKQFKKNLNDLEEQSQKTSRKNEYKEDIDILKFRIKYENDINKKIELQRQLREETLKFQLEELEAKKQEALIQNEIDKKANIRKTYGDKGLQEYEQTGTLEDDSQGVLEFYKKKADGIIKQYSLEQEGIQEQSERSAMSDELDENLSRYEDYLQGMLDAEQQYQEELARIREENGLRADADIENSADVGIKAQVQRAKDQRDTAQDIVKRDTGLTDDKWVTELGNLGAKVAGKAYDEVKKLYDEFISTVNDDIAEIEAQKVAAEKIANGGDVKTLKAETQEQLEGVETQLQDPNLKEQQKVDLLQQQLELKAQIAYYDAAEQGNAETLNSLTERGAQLVKVRNKAESDAANAKQRSNVKELTQQKKVAVANKSIVQGLESVRDMANDVANTFGGALSKKAKKALETMSQVADFGIDAVKGIETIVSGVSDGMIKTTAGASASMQALEKASFILTVISIAVQLIMKIVEIASQFTKSAQLQNSIDDHLAKVDELEKRQQMIEAQYATSQGSEYYKGLTDSARAYNEIIKKNKKALEEAEELYRLNLSKYGEDSEKTEEAKAQRDDLARQDVEFQNSQKEAWRSLMEELSGTSFDSFAENLADALIEGFAQGKEGIDEVWEDTMDDLLRTMMRNELALALKDQFKETFEKFTEDTKDGDLSQAEMDKFMENLEKGKETAEKIAGAYYDAMSEAGLLEDADAEGSQGFGQMTQDQADTLTARFTALQIEGANISAATQAMAAVVAEVGADTKLNVASLQTLVYNSNIALQIAQDQLDQMQIIADNTAMLAETNNRLKAIEQNTGRL